MRVEWGIAVAARATEPQTPPASFAKADDPVFQRRSRSTETPRRTGSPAGACHRARRWRDPVAGDDSQWGRALRSCGYDEHRRFAIGHAGDRQATLHGVVFNIL